MNIYFSDLFNSLRLLYVHNSFSVNDLSNTLPASYILENILSFLYPLHDLICPFYLSSFASITLPIFQVLLFFLPSLFLLLTFLQNTKLHAVQSILQIFLLRVPLIPPLLLEFCITSSLERNHMLISLRCRHISKAFKPLHLFNFFPSKFILLPCLIKCKNLISVRLHFTKGVDN